MTDTEKTQDFPARDYGDDVRIARAPGKTVLLVGTAHLSRQSLDLVERVIANERPDRVCVELDERRHQALANRGAWENLDLKQLIKNRQLSTLLSSLILASYQKRLGAQTGMPPGTELLAAAQAADRLSIPLSLCDRDIRVTLRRAWHCTPWYRKFYLVAAMLGSLFEKTEIDEDKLAELRRQDVLAEMLSELGDALPQAKRALIDERDLYMAEQIRRAEGGRIVAVVGAGHLEGIARRMAEDNSAALEEISAVAPVGRGWKNAAWLIPALIVSALVATGLRHGAERVGADALYWVLVNGIPAALGSVAALGYPATIAAAFFAAPFTSLTPLIGVGYVCAFVQVMARPPIVREFERIHDDIGVFSGWWRNRLLRIFLVFLFSSLGSLLGTFLGGYRILSGLFS